MRPTITWTNQLYPSILHSDINKLPPLIEKIKLKANAAFDKQQHTLAISLYNEALQRLPSAAVLYSNKAAALMKRQWYVFIRKQLYGLQLCFIQNCSRLLSLV